MTTDKSVTDNRRRRRVTRTGITQVLVATEYDGIVAILAELDRNRRFRRVGRLASFGETEAEALKAGADVVVVDVDTPAGFARLADIASTAPTVVVSGVPPEQVLLACVAVGARGFVWKPDVAEALDDAVAMVASGRTHLDPYRTTWPRETPVGVEWSTGAPMSRGVVAARQSEVLALVRKGLSNPQIALALGMSENTVKTHLSRAMRRLGAKNRHEAAAMMQTKKRGTGAGP